MLAPVKREKALGKAEVRQIFTIPKVGTIAGSFVTEGTIPRNAQVRLVRDSVQIYTGKLDVAAPLQGRRPRGRAGLRVRHRARELQRHQGRRHHRGVRDRGDRRHAAYDARSKVLMVVGVCRSHAHGAGEPFAEGEADGAAAHQGSRRQQVQLRHRRGRRSGRVAVGRARLRGGVERARLHAVDGAEDPRSSSRTWRSPRSSTTSRTTSTTATRLGARAVALGAGGGLSMSSAPNGSRRLMQRGAGRASCARRSRTRASSDAGLITVTHVRVSGDLRRGARAGHGRHGATRTSGEAAQGAEKARAVLAARARRGARRQEDRRSCASPSTTPMRAPASVETLLARDRRREDEKRE